MTADRWDKVRGKPWPTNKQAEPAAESSLVVDVADGQAVQQAAGEAPTSESTSPAASAVSSCGRGDKAGAPVRRLWHCYAHHEEVGLLKRAHFPVTEADVVELKVSGEPAVPLTNLVVLPDDEQEVLEQCRWKINCEHNKKVQAVHRMTDGEWHTLLTWCKLFVRNYEHMEARR